MDSSAAKIFDQPAARNDIGSALFLIDQIERSGADREAADRRITTFSNTLELLLPDLPPAEREAIRGRLDKVLGRHWGTHNKGGTFFDNVVSLFKNSQKQKWNFAEIQAELSKTSEVDSKTLYNTINYLAKTGRLKRIDRGQYMVLGPGAFDLEDVSDDGTIRGSEHYF